MKKSISNGWMFVAIIISFISCTSLKKIDIQVAIPPKNISPDIQSIAILNRCLTTNFTNLGRETTERLDSSTFTDNFMDSIAADSAIFTAVKAIFGSERYDIVLPREYNIRRDEKNPIPEPLDSASVGKICEEYNVDAVLVLEYFLERVRKNILKHDHITFFNSTFTHYIGNMFLFYKNKWTLYQTMPRFRMVDYEISDGLVWRTKTFFSPELVPKALPPIKEVLLTGGIDSGLRLADSISPKWLDENRYYYKTGRKEIDAAIPLLKKNKWEEAKEIWLKFSKFPSPALRSKIEHNLALAYEMVSDIDLALEWGLKSSKSRYSVQTERYCKTLDKRKSFLKGLSAKL